MKKIFNRNIPDCQGYSARATTCLRNLRIIGSTYRRTVLQLRACQGHCDPQTEFQIDKILLTRNKGGI